MALHRSITVTHASLNADDGQAKQAQVDRLRRLLAAVAHDLRQPLQTMSLLHGVLEAKVKDEEARKVINRLDDTLTSLTGILDTLISLDQSDTAITYPEYFTAAPTAEQSHITNSSQSSDAEKALSPTIFIIDDDHEVLEGMGDLLKSHGHSVELFQSCEQFLAACQGEPHGCLLVDALLPGASGLELLKKIQDKNYHLPAIMVTGSGDVELAVQAMKAGAADFIEKPVGHKELLAIVMRVLQQKHDATFFSDDHHAAIAQLARLSAREREVMNRILEGQPNKNIAADLGISQRTVETHRANIMKKTCVKSLPALLKLTLAAA